MASLKDNNVFFDMGKLSIETIWQIGADLGIEYVEGEEYEDTVYDTLSFDTKLEEVIEVLESAELKVICIEE